MAFMRHIVFKTSLAVGLLALTVLWAQAKPPAPAESKDTRIPVPLTEAMALHQKQNMRSYLLGVQHIVQGLQEDDYALISKSAREIGDADAKAPMCRHMGAGAPGFADQAIAFHRSADRIGAAADQRDKQAVLMQLHATLNLCTSCHETYRQQIIPSR